MIFDKLMIFRRLTPSARTAHKLATRWSAAGERDPALIQDVIRLSGILAPYPRRFEDGAEIIEPMDPTRLAIEQGRREMGQDLLALLGVGAFELKQLVELNNEMD